MALTGAIYGNGASFKWNSITSGNPQIRFYDTDESAYCGFHAAGTTTASLDYTLPAAGPASNGYVLASTTAGVMSWVANGAGTGTVTSVAMTVPGGFSVSGSPITTSGTLAITANNSVGDMLYANADDSWALLPGASTGNYLSFAGSAPTWSQQQNANKVFAGPTSGGDAVPAFRALVSADLAGVALSATSVNFAKAAETTIANTTTPTTFLDTGVGTKTVTANTLKAGSQIRFRCGGYYSTKVTLPGTFQIRFTLGTGFDEVITLQGFPANVSSTPGVWWSEFNWSILSIGGSGTVTGQGNFTYTNPLVADAIYGNGIKRSSTAIDTTANCVLDVTGTWTTADASNSITCEWATIEVFYN